MKRAIHDHDSSTIPRVALLLPSLGPGGAERQVATLADNLAGSGFEPLIISLTSVADISESVPIKDSQLICLNKSPSSNGLWLAGTLARALLSRNVAIVQSNNWGTLLEAVLACRLAHTQKHVHFEHGTVLEHRHVQGFKLLIRRLLGWAGLRHASKVCTVSYSVAQKLSRLCCYPLSRIQIVPYGVPAVQSSDSQRSVIRKRLGVDEQQILIGSVGRMHEVKGFDVLLPAIAALQKAGHNIACVLVGSGSELAPLKSLASGLGISSIVHFTGFQPDPGPWYCAMDIYVNSSRSEGLSVSVLEAMSCGLPLVVTDVGDHGRVVRSQLEPVGIVVEKENIQALAQALDTVCRSFESRMSLGQAARRLFQREFTLQAMINRYVTLYNNLLCPSTQARRLDRSYHVNSPA